MKQDELSNRYFGMLTSNSTSEVLQSRDGYQATPQELRCSEQGKFIVYFGFLFTFYTMNGSEKLSMVEKDEGSDISLLRGSYDEGQMRNSPRKPYITIFYLILAASVGALSASTIWAVFWPSKHSTSCQTEPKDEAPSIPTLHCGSTPAEARSLGCKLQTWSYTWVPEPCWDSELSAEFVAVHEKDDLPYYADRNGTQVVDFDTVYEGEIEELYTVWGSHFWHCAFLMRKFFRREAALTVASMDYEHFEHCQMWLTNPFRYEWRKVNTKAVLFYGTCDAKGFELLGRENFVTLEE